MPQTKARLTSRTALQRSDEAWAEMLSNSEVTSLPIGTIILLATAALVFLGFAQRVLDRMQLNDGQAILVLILMAAGSFVDFTVSRANPRVIVNAGGAIIPLALVVYVLIRATAAEKARAIITGIAAAVILYGIAKIFRFEEGQQFITPTYLFGIVAGIVAYVGTRSRRTAFVSGVLGVIGMDTAHLVEVVVRRLPSTVNFGGGGVFDSVVIAGVLAALLAEVVGETLERVGGGKHEATEEHGEAAPKREGNVIRLRGSQPGGGDDNE